MYLEKEVGGICFDWVGVKWLVHYFDTNHDLYFVSEVDSRNLLIIIGLYVNSAWVRILIPAMPLFMNFGETYFEHDFLFISMFDLWENYI